MKSLDVHGEERLDVRRGKPMDIRRVQSLDVRRKDEAEAVAVPTGQSASMLSLQRERGYDEALRKSGAVVAGACRHAASMSPQTSGTATWRRGCERVWCNDATFRGLVAPYAEGHTAAVAGEYYTGADVEQSRDYVPWSDQLRHLPSRN